VDGFVIGEISAEQGFEELAVVWDFQVQELVDNDVFPQSRRLGQEIEAESDDAGTGTGCPLPAHGLQADLAGRDADALGPAGNL
jgi:hypothetical protein